MATTILKAATTKTSAHIGGIGDRIHVEGVLRQVWSGLSIIADTDGNEFAYKSRRPIGSKGALVMFDATVDGHSEYKGIKRTEIASLNQQVVRDADADRIRAAFRA